MGRLVLVKKRDGEIVPFEAEKLVLSIEHAVDGSGKKVAQQVTTALERACSGLVPTTAQIRDVVIKVLAKNKKALEAYDQHKRDQKVEFKTYAGIRNDLNLDGNAMEALAKGLLQRNDQGRVTETPGRLFKRVAKALSAPDKEFGSARKAEEDFYSVMSKLEFLPSTQILATAGLSNHACQVYALPVDDDLGGIMRTARDLVSLHTAGASTGMNFTMIRPSGDPIKGSLRSATGPLSWATIYDTTTNVVTGEKRNTATLSIHHPDSRTYCENQLQTFQSYISLSPAFLEAVQKGEEFEVTNPKTKKTTKASAEELFTHVLEHAANGLGIAFNDQPVALGQPLEAYQALPTGSINLSLMVKEGKPDWNKLKRTVRVAVRMLDNVIDINAYEIPETEHVTKGHRRLGIGVTGFADMLARLDIPYSSPKAINFGEQLAKFLREEAEKMSLEIAKQRGGYPSQKEGKAKRNDTLLAILPTGVEGITGTAPSIEAFKYAVRVVGEEHPLLEVHPVLDQLLRDNNAFDLTVLAKALNKPLTGIPKKVQSMFVTNDILGADHSLKLQAAFQKHVDGGVLKTINVEGAKPADLKKLITAAAKAELSTLTFQA
ncbi:hypothetical protein CMO91_02880 [Candidatus Woesearchaeota archaeon]|nr:hypothetical protein [Candidatus Woesearchaeota archaeon]